MLDLKKMTKLTEKNYARIMANLIDAKFIEDCNYDMEILVNDILETTNKEDVYFKHGIINELISEFNRKSSNVMQLNGLYVVKFQGNLYVANVYYGLI